MRNLLALLSLLGSTPASAEEPDPACRHKSKLHPMHWVKDAALPVLGACVELYCKPELNASLRQDLKEIDASLKRMKDATDGYRVAFQKYKQACIELGKNWGTANDRMKDVRFAAAELKTRAEFAARIYRELQADAQGVQRSSTVDRMERVGEAAEKQFREPACKRQINELTLQRLNQNDAVTQEFEQVDCRLPTL